MNIDFMKSFKKVFVFSVFLVLASLGFVFGKGLNLGIDFKGGVLVEIHQNKDIDIENIKNILRSNGYEKQEVQYFGSNKNVAIRLDTGNRENIKDMGDEVFSLLKTNNNELILNRVEIVGPKVGDELTEAGIMAVLFVLVGILIYISFRFEYVFAIGAIVALVHDIVIAFGLISLLNIEFNLTVLAAILAILGYSLNDTIVLYDRIRENIEILKDKSLKEIINVSINETLSRTIMTSFTTFVALISLFIFGGEIMSGFSLTLIIGVIIGTYSSIYVAGSSLIFLNKGEKEEKLKNMTNHKYKNKEDGIV